MNIRKALNKDIDVIARYNYEYFNKGGRSNNKG